MTKLINLTAHQLEKTALIFILSSGLLSLLFSPLAFSTPLTDAIRDGNYKLAESLIAQGAFVDQVDNPRTPTALITVILKNETAIAKYLIEQGANVNAIHPGTQCSALQLAAGSINIKNPLEIVKLLVEKEADINRTGNYCGPAIMEAAIAGHLNIVQYLFEKKADINQQNASSYPLYEAVINHHQDVAQWLVEQGANPNIASKDGSTAVHIIAQFMPALFETVLAQGGKFTLDNNGRGVLGYALSGNNQAIVKKMLTMELSQEELDDALRIATSTKNNDMIKALLKKGANPKAKDPWGESAVSISKVLNNEKKQNNLQQTADLPW